jgi:type VI secretion system protein ImpL
VSAVWNVLKSAWFISLIGIILLSLLIWFVGPILGFGSFRPLAGGLTRFLVILVLFLIWGTVVLVGWLRRRKKNQELVNELAQESATGESGAEMAADEVARLRERMQDALGVLKQSKLGGTKGRQYLYQLPWYIMIGPPGSGKTTALQHSGLTFPLADRLRGDELEIKGVGGTRNCDWVFTNEAVLLDTAGRYTTQDSHETVDSAAWQGFLGLLKKYRPRQPINGVLIAISIADLMVQSDEDRKAHVRAIRMRLRELREQLGIRFPIYILFTKCDLVAGFVEFFDDLGRPEREQVWGMTFPLDEGKDERGVVQKFGEEFSLLMQRLNDRLIERLNQEQDQPRRSLIYGFPQQVASLREPIQEFLNEIFQPTRFEQRPLLRGVYFTSGTQYGNPIDRLLGAMAQTFGIGRQAVSGYSGKGRSYFLTRLLRGVVFPEASLVSANPRLERRRKWIQRGAYATAGVLVLAFAGLWWLSYSNNSALIEDAERRVQLYNVQIDGLEINSISDASLVPVLPPLETVRDIPAGYAEQGESHGWSYGLGLYQGDKIGAQAVSAYRHALNNLFLPRILLRLEQQMTASLENPEALYELLRIYLMLGGQGPIDEELVRNWLVRDWERAAYPGPGNAGTRRDLQAHLDAMLDMQPLEPVPLHGDLVARAQTVLGEVPLAQQAYRRIVEAPEAQQLRDWRVVDHGGPSVGDVFELRSGEPLTSGVSGIYTYDGFYDYFLPTMIDVVGDLAQERWVLDGGAGTQVDQRQLALLERDTLILYLDDYISRWRLLLSDLTVKDFENIRHAVQVTNTLSGPNSPIRIMLRDICVETRLGVEPERPEIDIAEGVSSGGIMDAIAGIAEYEARRRINTRTQNVIDIAGESTGVTLPGGGQGGGDEELPPPGQPVEDAFAELHRFAGCVEGGSEGQAPLDDLVRQFGDLRQSLSSMASGGGGGGGGGPGGGDVINDLMLDAGQMPEPVGGLVSEVAQQAADAGAAGQGGRLSEIWQSDVREFCVRALNNRYPIFRSSSNDVTLGDFARLFQPNGMIDRYFNENLAQYVDTSSRQWAWRQSAIDLGIPSYVLTQFQFAADIRDAFWPDGGGGAPRVSFEIQPERLSATANQVLLEVDGESLVYRHGAPRSHNFTWPGNTSRARIAFQPQVAGASSVTRTGAWAWFRLIDTGRITSAAGANRFMLEFDLGGRNAAFLITAGSVVNPFNLSALENFRCPQF